MTFDYNSTAYLVAIFDMDCKLLSVLACSEHTPTMIHGNFSVCLAEATSARSFERAKLRLDQVYRERFFALYERFPLL